MRKLLFPIALSLFIVFAAVAGSVAPAQAGVHPVRPHDAQMAAGEQTDIRIKLPKRVGPVHELCLTFNFRRDLLDVGDDMSIEFNGVDVGGFMQVAPPSRSERTLCYRSDIVGQNTAIAVFFQERWATVTVIVNAGSLRLDRKDPLDVTVDSRRLGC